MRSAVALALLVAVALAGCGGDSESDSGGGCLRFPSAGSGTDAKAQLRRAVADFYRRPLAGTTSSSADVRTDRMSDEAEAAFERFEQPTTGTIRVESSCRWETTSNAQGRLLRIVGHDGTVAFANGADGKLRRAAGDARATLLQSTGADRDPVRGGGSVRALGGGRFEVKYGFEDAEDVAAYFGPLLGSRGKIARADGRFVYAPGRDRLSVDALVRATIDYGRSTAAVEITIGYALRSSPGERVPAPRTDGTVSEVEDLAP